MVHPTAGIHPFDLPLPPPPPNPHRHSYTPAPTRRASMILPSLSRNKSLKSLRDRRRSSGTLSACSSPRKCIGEYYIGKILGKGASGRVKLGIHRYTGEHVAIKIISKAFLAANPTIEKAVRREIAIMKLIRHPNVVGLLDVIDDEASPNLYIILEYVEGGELFEYLVSKGRLTENEARRHFQHMILGLDYCHHHLICHRDLKPENLLLDSSNNIKIADFGMASLQPAESMLQTSCGSPHYASPEIVTGMPYNGAASDIWSCGVILYALLAGHLPFDDDNIRSLLNKVKAGKYAMPNHISRSAQDLLRRILVVDPNKRINMKQIMAHPWFREHMHKLGDPARFPVPPSPQTTEQPVQDPSEIDDRILETIKFLWGESNPDAVVRALISKEPNMQKVVYVLLQEHAERYWQNDHDDNVSDSNEEEEETHRYHTIRPIRHCRSMAERGRGGGQNRYRPEAPWMPELPTPHRRYSAVSMRVKQRTSVAPQQQELLESSPDNGVADIKKSPTLYDRLVRRMRLSKRQSKEKVEPLSPASFPLPLPPAPAPATQHHQGGERTTGTMRLKNMFTLRASKTPVVSSDNKKDTSSPSQDGTLSPRLSKGFTLRRTGTTTATTKGRRKQINMGIFEQPSSSNPANGSNVRHSILLPPSSPVMKETNQDNDMRRRISQGSFQSFDRRSSSGGESGGYGPSSNCTAGTPSLMSDETSTITSSSSNNNNNQQPSHPSNKTSTAWIQNLFFFKQPKVCSLVIQDETHVPSILYELHSVLNKVSESRLYEKNDKHGVRYKAEIRKSQGGKSRIVKSRMEILVSHHQRCARIQFTQQQGDGILLTSIIKEAQHIFDKRHHEKITISVPPTPPLPATITRRQPIPF
ncbi:hypothetical protein O0I10_007065 [Lichtheimia ornata]|uniref:Protein kinase domain-containing protein n=1 Tax=Lichtheimia ornata TaxID=688661 RepID=A0AAD7V0V8_9FUNG|nr:uncharacterized protein O0I10_007065 [Lichtheimia ornata]KAJ8657249.1 hypothetical protein O0I10_007065 [Lichtheimia ornata]